MTHMKSVRPYDMTTRAAAAAQTADRIVDGTQQLFAEQPINEITLADIADRSGVTVQTIVRHFGDKSAVFAAAIARFSADVQAQRGQAPADDVDDLVDNLCEHYETYGRLVLKMLGEEASSPGIRPALDSGRDYHRRWCARVFGETLSRLSGAERTRRLAQLTAICDVRSWEVLRLRCALSRHQTRIALREMLRPLTTEL